MELLIKRHTGFDHGPVNIDPLGKAYLVVAALWTCTLAFGIGCVLYYRDLDFIRIRNITLMISSLLMIHVYLVLVLLNYPLNGAFPCPLGYWIISVHFPIGMALFQAQNVQLLSLSVLQRRLVAQSSKSLDRPARPNHVFPGLWAKWAGLSLLSRTYVCIAVGVVVQLCVVFFVFFMSRKFHPFGLFSRMGNAESCRRGWEWIPSAIWQGLWTFGFGPWLLFRIRKINDIHKWRLQTTLAVIFFLPGLPLWLAATYSPYFRRVNLWWPPSMWYAPGLFMMEIVTLFFPLLEVYINRRERKATANAIVEWERRNHDFDSLQTILLRYGSIENMESQTKTAMYNMQALERALETNARELLEFAATKQFTGENIVFLTRVRDWKERWARTAQGKASISLEAQGRLYEVAKAIFERNVSLHTSQFPVNLESKVYHHLEGVFGTSTPRSSRSIISPFTELWDKRGIGDCKAGFEEILRMEENIKPEAARGSFVPPFGFDGAVFDEAERSIKHIVFTNTWGRYLDFSSQRPLP